MTCITLPRRALAAVLTTLALVGAAGGIAKADDIANNLDTSVDATAEVVALQTAGTASVIYRVVEANGDGKNGCNLTGGTSLAVSVSSSNPAAVSVSPSQLTFTSCGATPSVMVTGLAAGSSTITLSLVANTTAGTFDLAPAAFRVDVTAAQTATTTTVTCPTSVTYDGTAQEPCTAVVTGAGGFSQQLAVSYADNTDAGTAAASASFAGNGNHLASSGSATFEVTKASSAVVVTCPASVTYDGTAQEPCSAVVTGVGGLTQVLAVSYEDNTDAGTATASASYAGGANHEPSSASEEFEIAKAPSQVVVVCDPASVVFTGSPIAPCAATVVGAGGLNQSVPVSYVNNVGVGTATASASYDGDANHEESEASATFEITAWTLHGFYQPVDMSTSSTVWNTVKGGSTVPLKFRVFAGSTELTSTAAVKSFDASTVNCSSGGGEDAIELTSTGGTSLRYDTTGGQFIQNWQTPKASGKCYRVVMTTQDGSSLTAWFKLK